MLMLQRALRHLREHDNLLLPCGLWQSALLLLGLLHDALLLRWAATEQRELIADLQLDD